MEIVKWVYIISGFSILSLYVFEDVFVKGIELTTKDMVYASIVAVLPIVNTLLIISILNEYYKEYFNNSYENS